MNLFVVFQYSHEYSQPIEIKIIWAKSEKEAKEIYSKKEELSNDEFVDAREIPDQFRFTDYPNILLEL